MKKEQILIRISGKDRIGLTADIMAILAKYDAQILDIGQADIHSTLTLGILIRIDEESSGQVMKELLFKITELGSISIGFAPVSDEDYEAWAGRQGRNRYILTVIARSLSAEQIHAATQIISAHGLNIDAIRRLTGRMSIMHPEKNVRACVEFSVRGFLSAEDKKAMQKDLMAMGTEAGIDFSFQKDDMYRRMRRLICFDMDSTLIQAECIDELARRHGVYDKVAAITERAMRGEIDFKESFTQRVALLKGLDISVMQDIAEHLPITEGTDRLMSVLKTCGYKIAILSGGFTFFGEYLQRKYGFACRKPSLRRIRPPQGRSAAPDRYDRTREHCADHRRGRRRQRPPHAQRSRPGHRLPRQAARKGKRPTEHQHHRPGRCAVLYRLQGQPAGRTGKDVT